MLRDKLEDLSWWVRDHTRLVIVGLLAVALVIAGLLFWPSFTRDTPSSALPAPTPSPTDTSNPSPYEQLYLLDDPAGAGSLPC